MHPAVRSVIGQLGRKLLLVAVAIGSVVAFVSIAGGTGTQTAQHITIVPIPVSPTDLTSSAVATSLSDAADASAPAAGHSVAPAPASTKAPAVAAATTNTAPTSAPPTSSPSSQRSRSGRATTTTTAAASPSESGGSAGPSIYRYTTMRDIAAIVNPQRQANGWAAITTAAAKNSASCIATSTCGGQIGTCGLAPNGIGTAGSRQVSDGQYEDQYGNCRELISY